MKRLLILLLFAAGGSGLYAQEITTIILVRHAEKGFDEAGDPDLTEEGEKRAGELQRVLKDTEIDFIYSTPFKRTKQTVKFLAEARDLEVLDYNPFKLDDVIGIINENKGKTILFSGHSNTTPVILNKLVGEDRYRQLDDKDYDNLYIVTYLSSEQAKVVSLEYGEDSEM